LRPRYGLGNLARFRAQASGINFFMLFHAVLAISQAIVLLNPLNDLIIYLADVRWVELLGVVVNIRICQAFNIFTVLFLKSALQWLSDGFFKRKHLICKECSHIEGFISSYCIYNYGVATIDLKLICDPGPEEVWSDFLISFVAIFACSVLMAKFFTILSISARNVLFRALEVFNDTVYYYLWKN
jgi:hypothetical protein